ncbi:uncharacterized protein BX663DRAFT_551002 [Cokeromyces recurvatus]|uniref:uncharacterized protein n=1 Tax=Cokeromyces recurvatus TaxID=90255 RepID=UPI00221E9513|nr:uncharacterized protein BX663DRAFT_551002 [Cokeromyces recurvatus]KAI7903937.1 hypothetical protein BX663DRAFT_551002 [Cokeromyces recurvatus]
MAKTSTSSCSELARIAKEYEKKEDWQKAIEAHTRALNEYEKIFCNEKDKSSLQHLETFTKMHTLKINEIKKKMNKRNPFDMKKLKQEINAIQRGELSLQQQQQQQQLINDSYAIVPLEEDEEDPFNKFWGVVEPMVDKLSNSITVSSPINESYLTLHTSQPKRLISYDTTDNEKETERIQQEMSSITECFFLKEKDKSSKEENESLKAEIMTLTTKIKELEKKSIDSTILKSHIIQFKNDVHKEALRILQTQENAIMTRSAMVNSNGTLKNFRHTTAERMNRIKELENANRVLRAQNRKQEALMNKYRERWEKLKEGAKKRQSPPLNDNNNNVV